MKIFFLPKKENSFYPYALRVEALIIYSILLAIFNLIVVPLFGLSNKAYSSEISENALVELANRSREAVGLSPLRVNEKLKIAAENKGKHMFKEQYWAHYAPDGTSPWFFIIQAGYDYTYAGENLAKDFVTAEAVHEAWMNSPTHRDNILNPYYEDIGIAVVEGTLFGEQTTIVVQMFGSLNEKAEYTQNVTQEIPSTKIPVPQITSPKDGEVLNKSQITVTGKGANGLTISIYDNNKNVVEATANEGIFSVVLTNLKDGEHIFSARAKDSSGRISEESNKVKVTIDTIPPALKSKETKLFLKGMNITVTLQPTEKLKMVTILFSGKSIPLNEDQNGTFVGSFALQGDYSNYEGQNITVTLTDMADNTTTENIRLPSFEIISQGNITPVVSGVSSTVVTSAMSYINSLTPQQKLNIAVGLFLTLLFVIDAVVLWKMGLFRQQAKTVLHIPILIIGIIITIFGINGTII